MPIASGQVQAGITPLLGTYNPTITCSTSGGFNLNTGVDTASYVKIGKLVHVQGKITTASKDGTPDGQLRISLPFNINSSLAESSGHLSGSVMICLTGVSLFSSGEQAVAILDPVDGVGFFKIGISDGSTAISYVLGNSLDEIWTVYFSIQYIAAS